MNTSLHYMSLEIVGFCCFCTLFDYSIYVCDQPYFSLLHFFHAGTEREYSNVLNIAFLSIHKNARKALKVQ